MNYITLDEATDWFLSKQSMSPKKLQKMLYYAYSWGIVFLNDSSEKIENKLFEANFKAWVHGPVNTTVYHQFKPYGFLDIPQKEMETPLDLAPDIQDILNQVLDVYGDFNGNQLESLTHSEDPWRNARKGLLPMDSSSTVISDKDIYNFYVTQLGD